MRWIVLGAAALATLPLLGCLTASIPAWQHFDAFSNQPTFHDMVMTGGKLSTHEACHDRQFQDLQLNGLR